LPDKKKPKYKELLNFIYQCYPKETREMIEVVDQISSQQIEMVLTEIPEEAMGQIYKEWVLKLLLHRKQWIVNWYMEAK
jgi:hypothetical protein